MSASREDVIAATKKPEQPANNPWPDRLSAWRAFSEKFHERGRNIEMRYEDERDASGQTAGMNIDNVGSKRVNLFYSNVTIIKESLYNSLPSPDVSRVHKGEFDNEPARVAATIVERGLTYEVECAPYFDQAIKNSILDRLVPGLGILWCNFKQPSTRGTKQIPEMITVDIVYWKDFLYEPRRAWEQVTWAGRKLHIDKAVANKRWGPTALEQPPEKNQGAVTTVDNALEKGKVCVIEMWDKSQYEVVYMTPAGTVLETVKDPYELADFWPFPKPLIASPPTRRFLPMPEYYMAQDQYIVCDILYARINLIIEAVRVAGVYDSSIPEIGRMLSGTENKLIPVDNWAMFADKGGTKGVIDWFPVEQVATVLTHLVSTYEFIKSQLFEVTGMADIIRGNSNQYETAAAQKIKAQFAGVRMGAFQRDVGVYVTSVLRVMAEMMCQLYSDAKLSAVCGQLPADDQQFVPAALAILRDDFMKKYTVAIEADSLTQADWGLEQEQRMQYVTVLAQFLQSAVPAAKEDPSLAPLLIQMIKFASVGFKGSSELEGAIDKTLSDLMSQPPKEEPPDPAVIKAQADAAKSQGELEIKREEARMKQQERQEELAFKREEHQMDMAFAAQKHEQEMAFEREKFGMETQRAHIEATQEIIQDDARFQHEREQDETRLAAEIANQPKKEE